MARKRDDYSVLRMRIVLTILSGYGLALIVFFGYALFTFPEKYFLGPFRLNWTLIQTAMYFIENLIPIHCAARRRYLLTWAVCWHYNQYCGVGQPYVWLPCFGRT